MQLRELRPQRTLVDLTHAVSFGWTLRHRRAVGTNRIAIQATTQSAITDRFNVTGLKAARTNCGHRNPTASKASNIAATVATSGHRRRHANNTTIPKAISANPTGAIRLAGKPAC